MADRPDSLFDSVPTRAAMILRAKAAELEAQILSDDPETAPMGPREASQRLVWLIADVALIASILAEFIEWSQEWSGRDADG